MSQLVGHSPIKQKVARIIPRQGTCLGCRFSPYSWGVYERQQINVSLSLSPSLPLSFSLKNKGLVIVKERKKITGSEQSK